MKICVLVPSKEYMLQAGVRIRYRRIEDSLQSLGHQLTVEPIQNFISPTQFVHDIYIISKCYDAQALLVAQILSTSPKLLGVDLFDDYFSQVKDSRFVRLRLWLQALLKSTDFVLCSTPAMAEIGRTIAPQLPVHVMNDPSHPLDVKGIGASAQDKLDTALKTGILNVGWFGIGDNPHFSVGLKDLAAYGGALAELRGHGYDVRLDILTNVRAMTPDGLALLRRLPLPYTIEEWSEEREIALLDKSLACFIPVNAQNFSIVKSLNRAISALSAGVQVLSNGYPLYDPLSPFIYRNPARLMADLTASKLALRKASMSEFERLMDEWASPEREARKLAEFLTSCVKGERLSGPLADLPFAAVVHGMNSTGDVHKLAQRMGALSVGSPFCKHRLNFNIRFSISEDGKKLETFVEETLARKLRSNFDVLLTPHGKIIDKTYLRLDIQRLLPDLANRGVALGALHSPLCLSASYPAIMHTIEKTIETLLPGTPCYFSEQSKLPLWRPGVDNAHKAEAA